MTEALVLKWSPLMDDVDDQLKDTLAQCLENEVVYLKTLSDDDRERLIGKALRFYFPIMRLVIGEMTVLDRLVVDDFREHVDDLVKNALRRCVEHHPSDDGAYTYESLLDTPDLAAFTRRLTDSYVSLQA